MEIKIMKVSDIKKCPGFILLASHYREDGSCRHDEIICEEEGCKNNKFGGEIFCEHHLREMYGDDFEEI